MAEAYEFLFNELTVDERNDFWSDYYQDEVEGIYQDLMDEEF
jgi:hypothetical protein